MEFMNKTEFIELYYPNLKEETYSPKRYEEIYTTLCDSLSELDPSKELSVGELKNIIISMSFKSLSPYYTAKKMMLYIFEAHGFNFKSSKNLRSIQYEDVCLDEDMYRTYFSSEDEIYNTISVIAKENRDADFQATMVACGLLWFGLTLAAIQRILVDEIDFENSRVFDSANARNVDISKTLLNHISSLLRNRNIKSLYLLCGKSGGVLQESSTGKRLAFLNNYEEISLKHFSAKDIYYSGLFSRVYDGKEDYEKLTKDKKIKYEAWVKKYRE